TAVLVHHGGIGTSAQAMAAGTKQIVVPFSHDQFDNADRMKRLGIAAVITDKAYQAAHVAEVVGRTLADPAMDARCHEIARRFVGTESIAQTCDLIEAVVGARALPV